MEDNNINVEDFVRIDYVKHKFEMEKASVYSYIKKGIIPQGLRISHKRTVWNKQDIDKAYQDFICQAYKKVA
jgi:predicted DNA-binding transcriptional regulator AlpA